MVGIVGISSPKRFAQWPFLQVQIHSQIKHSINGFKLAQIQKYSVIHNLTKYSNDLFKHMMRFQAHDDEVQFVIFSSPRSTMIKVYHYHSYSMYYVN